MKSLYLKLPYFFQFFIVNFVSLYKVIIRRWGRRYKKSVQYYRSYLNGSDFWQKEFERRKNSFLVFADPIFYSGKIINKNFVKSNINIFKNNEVVFRISAKTSGSSGNGLSFVKTFFSEQDTWAAYDVFRELHGVNSRSWCGYFCGNMITSLNSNFIFHIAYPSKQIIFSQYHLSYKTIKLYIDTLNNRKPPWIHGYPSFLLELVRLAERENLSLDYVPSLITTGSENISRYQKNILFSFFKVRVRDLYCQSEMVAMIFECQKGSLHVNEAYSIVDFLKTDIENCYKIVGTNLNNHAFRLFNYDTEDLVEWYTDNSCTCGIKGRVVSNIDGRQEDYLKLPSGECIGRLDHVFKGDLSIYQAQFIQNSNTLETKLYIKVDYDKFNIEKLKKNIGFYIKGLNIDIILVDYIVPENNGKIKLVKRC